jgi:tetratricopeptide (TPR) repeat protein
MADLLENPKLCAKCGAPGCSSKCPCKQVQYCGKECQAADWPTHKQSCRARLDKKVGKAKKQHGRENVAVAKARMEAGFAHANEGRYGEAERCYVEARRIYTAVHGEDHPDTASACMHLGQTFNMMLRNEEALVELNKCLDFFRRTEGGRSGDVGSCLHNIARVFQSRGRHEEALERLEEACGIFKELHAEEYVPDILSDMSDSYRQLNNLDKALEKGSEALRFARNSGSETKIAVALSNTGVVHRMAGRLAEARECAEEALGIERRLHGEKHPGVASLLSNIGCIAEKQGKYDEALKLHRKVLKIERKIYGDDYEGIAWTLRNMGNASLAKRDNEQAVDMYEESLEVFGRACGVGSKKHAMAHGVLAQALEIYGDEAGALEKARECVRMNEKLGGVRMNEKLGGVDDAFYAVVLKIIRRLEDKV